MKFINATTCQWKHAIGEDGPKPDPDPAPNRLLSLEQWHAVKTRWPANTPVAIEFPNDADINQLAPDLNRIAVVVLDFPKWTDGRAYSQAHILRSRHKFTGAIRARGEVLVDMMQLLARTGFDEAVMRGDQSQAAAQKALALFAPVGFYQGDVGETRPWFLEERGMSEVSSLPWAAAPAAGNAIGLYAKWTPTLDAKIEAALQRLRDASIEHGDGLVQSSSLGVEDMVITDLIARTQLPIAISTLDTGKLHAETLALIPRIQERYGRDVEVFSPVADAVIQFVTREGEEPMYKSIELRKACCGLRKMEPLGRMLKGRSAWITGLRREQSGARGDVAFDEDDGNGRRKISPIADWTWAEVWAYVEKYDVPYNPLHDQFMPSIGCAPCTRAIAVGEDFRAGRWWWEDSTKECGLHAKS